MLKSVGAQEQLRRIREVVAALAVATSLVGCGWQSPGYQAPVLVAVVAEEGELWLLSYKGSWRADDIAASAGGGLTLGDWSPRPVWSELPAPEAIVPVGDKVLVAAKGQAYLVSRDGKDLTAQPVGACPRDIRQMTVISAVNSTGSVSLAILAGGEYEEGRLKRAAIFLAPLEDGHIELKPSGYDSTWHPWLLEAGKMGGRPVLFVGALKAVHFDEREANRPQLFEIVSTEPLLMRPMWLGSSLSRPFEDAILVDSDGDGEDELAAVEWTRDGQFMVQLYTWRGSGFEGITAIDQTYDKPPGIAAAALHREEPQQALIVRAGDLITAYELTVGDESKQPQLIPVAFTRIAAGAPWVVIPGSRETPAAVTYKNSKGQIVLASFRPSTLAGPARAQ